MPDRSLPAVTSLLWDEVPPANSWLTAETAQYLADDLYPPLPADLVFRQLIGMQRAGGQIYRAVDQRGLGVLSLTLSRRQLGGYRLAAVTALQEGLPEPYVQAAAQWGLARWMQQQPDREVFLYIYQAAPGTNMGRISSLGIPSEYRENGGEILPLDLEPMREDPGRLFVRVR